MTPSTPVVTPTAALLAALDPLHSRAVHVLDSWFGDKRPPAELLAAVDFDAKARLIVACGKPMPERPDDPVWVAADQAYHAVMGTPVAFLSQLGFRQMHERVLGAEWMLSSPESRVCLWESLATWGAAVAPEDSNVSLRNIPRTEIANTPGAASDSAS